jgi:hypothetical protein
MSQYKSYDVVPCKNEPHSMVIGCPPDDAEFWGIYGVNKRNEMIWIQDVKTEEGAQAIAKRFRVSGPR